MLIVSAVYDAPGRQYRKMAENLRKSAEIQGYAVILKELNDDPMDLVRSAHDYRVNCFFKPHVILEALNALNEDVVWVDGDCLIRERFDEILVNCDVAVTLRRFRPNTIRDVYDGYINAGVMAFRNCDATKRFIECWISEQPHGRADQDALNRVLLNYTDMNQYGEIVNIDGCLVKVVPCDIYNFFFFPEDHSKAKILHVKGSLRPDHYDRLASEVLGVQ